MTTDGHKSGDANMAKRQFKSVVEMVRSISDLSGTAELIQEKVAARAIVSKLIALRLKKDLSQGDIAQEMNCTQSRVSKLENGVDNDLTIADIGAYLKALGMKMGVLFHNDSDSLMERVKLHAYQIVDCLQTISSLSNGDESMEQAAVQAHLDTIVNLTRFVATSVATIPSVNQELKRIVGHSKKGKGKKEPEAICVHLVNEELLPV